MRFAMLTLAAVAGGLVASEAGAQYVYVSGYAPATVVVDPVPVVTYRPVAPVVAYAPVVGAPAPLAPAAVVAAPRVVRSAVVTTRRRPILGGTVSRVRGYYSYAPVVLAY